MNPAVAYLVMARGTGGDHRTTSWSVHAIETHTGISRDRAKVAVKALVSAGLVEIERTGTKPRYSIVPAYAVEGCRAFDEERALDRLFGVKVEPLKNWVWLPNLLVDGPSEPFPPVERVRRTGQIEVLRIFVDLYAEQTFTTEGGLPWREGGMRRPFRRTKIGKGGGRIVWGFTPDDVIVDEGDLRTRYGAGFRKIVDVLVRIGLLDFVPHLVEHDGLDAEIHHSMAGWGAGDEDERMLAVYLSLIAESMLPAEKISSAKADGVTHLVPLQDFMTGIRMVGIPRLRHRAGTKMLSDWRARNAPLWDVYSSAYNEVLRNLQHKGTDQGTDQGPYQGSDQGPVQGAVVEGTVPAN